MTYSVLMGTLNPTHSLKELQHPLVTVKLDVLTITNNQKKYLSSSITW